MADSRTFYLKVCTYTPTYIEGGALVMFGDIASVKSGDAYACQILGQNSDLSASGSITAECVAYSTSGNTSYGVLHCPILYGPWDGDGAIRRVFGFFGDALSGSNGTYCTYPNGPNNGLILVEAFRH